MRTTTNRVEKPDFEVVWRPIPGTSQELALSSRADVTLYTGTRGPGKTDCQLMRFRRNVGQGYGPFWRGIIFDREYKSLDDLVSKSKRWFNAFNDGARWLSSRADYKWVWPSGEELLIRAASDEADYWRYHGQEFPFIGFNELCKYPNLKFFDMIQSCNRSSYTTEKDATLDDRSGLPINTNRIPLEVFATTNPFGVGHNQVKSRFIDPAPYGRVLRVKTQIYDPKTREEVEVERTQVALFGSWRENIYLDPKYIAQLTSDSDENRRKAWVNGSWDIVSGGVVDDVWKREIHVIPRFKVPKTWPVDRSLDWGSSHPYSVGWWAEANGEEARLENGQVICPPPGTIIQIGELYGATTFGANVGNRKSAADIAIDIRNYETKLLVEGWIAEQVWPGPADNQIANNNESSEESIETKFANYGVQWEKSNKNPGSRKNGLQLFRDRLEAAKRNELSRPWILFMENCRASIATIPTLPRDEDIPDDADTDAEDHAYDMVRYRVLKGSIRVARTLPFKFPR